MSDFGEKTPRLRAVKAMKAAKPRKRTKKTNYMSDKAFADFKQALEDALALSVACTAI